MAWCELLTACPNCYLMLQLLTCRQYIHGPLYLCTVTLIFNQYASPKTVYFTWEFKYLSLLQTPALKKTSWWRRFNRFRQTKNYNTSLIIDTYTGLLDNSNTHQGSFQQNLLLWLAGGGVLPLYILDVMEPMEDMPDTAHPVQPAALDAADPPVFTSFSAKQQIRVIIMYSDITIYCLQWWYFKSFLNKTSN